MRLLTLVSLCAAAVGCSGGAGARPGVEHRALVAFLSGKGAQPVECPEDLPPPPQAMRGVARRCFRAPLGGEDLAREVIAMLPAGPTGDPYAHFRWNLVRETRLAEGCPVALMDHARPYPYRGPGIGGAGGWCLLWFIDRSRCPGGGTLVVVQAWGP
jgi:hypothetical protein